MKFKATLRVILAIILVMLGVSAYAWYQLPEGSQIPIHFDLNGNSDSYGGKVMGLLFAPAMVVIITILYLTIPLIEPRSRHLQLSHQAYSATIIASILVLAIVHFAIAAIALGMNVDMITVIDISFGIMLIVIGNFLSKTRSTLFFGIRTRWTLTSELSWFKTHRLGGWLFILHGIGLIISGLVSSSILLIFLLASLLITSVALNYYSYLVWKDDPEKGSESRSKID